MTTEITAPQVYQKLANMINEWQQFLDQFGDWQTAAGPTVTLTHPDGSTSLHQTLAHLTQTLTNWDTWYTSRSAEIASSAEWAVHPVDQLVPIGNGVDEYSALHHRHYADLAQAAAEVAQAAAHNSELAAKASELAAAASEAAAASSASAASASEVASANSAAAAATSETAAANSASAASASKTAAANSASAANVSKNAAKASETAAKASETAAKSSETAAAASEAAAANSASSANTSKNAAKASETAAKASETAAANSETASANSASAANTSKNAAAASASAASASETAAANSASAANTSKNAAAASATAAAASETAAKNSETAAAASETAAKASETGAASSASSASSSKTAAANSAAAAATSETAAANSAAAASASEMAAANSASAANTSKNAAAASATAAKSSETAAANSASAASSSKTAAASSATAAASSASSASSSKTAAANSASAALASETAAASSKSAAAASEATATIKASEASSSATKAQQWAEHPQDSDIPGEAVGTRSAKHWAEIAHQYAQTVSSALIWRGGWDASAGNYPTPSMSPETADYYRITVPGTMTGTQGSLTVEAGDYLHWDIQQDIWFKIDATDAVNSVNGKTGAVVLSKADVGLGNARNVPSYSQAESDGRYVRSDVDTSTSGSFHSKNLTFDKATVLANGTDLNTLTTSGFYNGHSLINAPNGDTNWWYLFVLCHTYNTSYCLQRAWDLNTQDKVIYERRRVSGVWGEWYKSWTSGNDGSGSGLDADMVDGLQGSQLARVDAANTFLESQRFTAGKGLLKDGEGVLFIGNSGGLSTEAPFWKAFQVAGETVTQAGSPKYPRGALYWTMGKVDDPTDLRFVIETGNLGTLPCDIQVEPSNGGRFLVESGSEISGDLNVTGANLTHMGNPVWHTGNDGNGSGLDADLLDGREGYIYAKETSTKPVSRITWAEAGSVGTPGNTITDVYGESDFSSIDANKTFGFLDAWAAVETHGGRLPTLEEVMDGVGRGSGQGYDTNYIWTCTFEDSTHVWVVKGDYITYPQKKLVDITDPAEVYHTRCFFDVERGNKIVRYHSDGVLRSGNNLVWHAGNDGAGSGLDADTVDGIQGANIARRGASLTSLDKSFFLSYLNNPALANAEFPSSGGGIFPGNGDSATSLVANVKVGSWYGIGFSPTISGMPVPKGENAVWINVRDGRLYARDELYAQSNQKVWHTGNDGAGSGLDADTLDGKQLATIESEYQSADANKLDKSGGTMTGRITTSSDIRFTGVGVGSGLLFNSTTIANDAAGIRQMGTNNNGELEFFTTDDDVEPFVFRHYTAGQDGSGSSVEWFKIDGSHAYHRGSVVWDASNDGAGSGLDADTLDGQQGVYYDHTKYGLGGLSVISPEPNSVGPVSGFYNHNSSTTNTPHESLGNFVFLQAVGDNNNQIFQIGSYGSGGDGGNGHIYARRRWQSSWKPWEKLWTDQNHGADSGLDADKVRGVSGTLLARKDTDNYYQPGSNQILSNNQGYYIKDASGANRRVAAINLNSRLQLGQSTTAMELWALNGEVTINSSVMWHAGNDGSGSGLDADTLDGLNSTDFVRSNAVTNATAEYSTTSHIESGRGSGGVALTINDGHGNANVTWNHKAGVPEQNGNAARIKVNTDSQTGATMWFELKSGVTAGQAVQTVPVLILTENEVKVECPNLKVGTETVYHTGNDPRGDYAYLSAPTAFTSDYKNYWASHASVGNSMSTSSDGILILETGHYKVEAYQRSKNAERPYISVALNGDRGLLEGRTAGTWYHDHASSDQNSSSQSFYLGLLNAGELITVGPPSSHSANLHYGAASYQGKVMITRVK
ncbi:pyocin knob domain-containing protein [Oceanimonas pelagia]|uniref:Pyocin knob domain-containing protein n=1 Tax=Oceanimonas pelagia TaxID=3028314 RepID=A0AA50KJW5_9GAMM|nr:pyocin knob domain-containing protein [Oceanimonas pelagia]WMC09496.1 pyocin knob domain-containing protein [Oceanimonas pelagia]